MPMGMNGEKNDCSGLAAVICIWHFPRTLFGYIWLGPIIHYNLVLSWKIHPHVGVSQSKRMVFSRLSCAMSSMSAERASEWPVSFFSSEEMFKIK